MGCSFASARPPRPPAEAPDDATGAPRAVPEARDAEEARARADRRDKGERRLSHTNSQNFTAIDVQVSRSLSMCKLNSQDNFAAADQTIIIFDWDDTLCPSTALKPFMNFDTQGRLKPVMSKQVRQELKQLEDQIVPLLRFAQTLGRVVLVTNARRPWIKISTAIFLPGVKEIMKDIQVIYAIELLRETDSRGSRHDASVLTQTKVRAMRAAVTEFYSRYANQSWKNIVSIGDAFFEHNAIRQVVQERAEIQPSEKRCRTKTVKLLEEPTVNGLIVQLSIIGNWLPKIVQTDDDVSIDLSAGEERINDWVNEFGDVM